jgi:hypothetical protein
MFVARQGFFRSQGPAPHPNPRREGTPDTNPAQSWTAQGAVTKTAIKEFGTASMFANTSNDEIITAVDPTFMDYGTGEFTIEWWQYIPSLSGHGQSCDLFSQNLAGGFGLRLAQSFNTNGLSSANPKYVNIFARAQADLDNWDITTRTGGGSWTASQWYFCVIQRKGTTMSFWVDGELCTRSGSGGGTRNFASASVSSRVFVGTADGGNGAGPIYIDEMCWSNTYRYDDPAAAIPIPSAPFTVDSYTTQLMHMDGANDGTTFTNDEG